MFLNSRRPHLSVGPRLSRFDKKVALAIALLAFEGTAAGPGVPRSDYRLAQRSTSRTAAQTSSACDVVRAVPEGRYTPWRDTPSVTE